MARTRLAMPVFSSGLTRAKCRAALGPLGLHSHTCPGQTRCRHDVVARALRKEWSHWTHGGQPANWNLVPACSRPRGRLT
eukprot:15464834-Alexandrium_andersonii.AAC.1